MEKEIESWSGFCDSLRAADRDLFRRMMGECRAYAAAVNTKGEPFPAEALLMALVLAQHRTIGALLEKVKHERLDL